MFLSQLTLTLRGVVLIATLMLCLQGVALAEQNPYSVTYVMPGCRAFIKGGSLNSFKQGWCSGLITGLAQMHRRCMPPQLTQRQLASAIVQYIDARPARMHEDFRILAAEAMQAAWPCKRHKYRGRPRPKAASDVWCVGTSAIARRSASPTLPPMKFDAAIEGDKSALSGTAPPRPLTSERAGSHGEDGPCVYVQ